jgi:UDP-N-acetylmuramate dehydrogenase
MSNSSVPVPSVEVAESIFAAHHGALADVRLESAELSAQNTLGLACRAQSLIMLHHTAQLPGLTKLTRQFPQVFVLGGGSNVVLPPELSALVLKVEFKGIALAEALTDCWLVDVAAGEDWHGWVQHAIQRGWLGLENLALIPGTVGAAPVQNIGAYGVELQDRIESVTAWNIPQGVLKTLTRAECEFAYRDSIFKRAAQGTWLIVSVRFRLPKVWHPVLQYPDLQKHFRIGAGDTAMPTAQQVFDAVCAIRRAKLPDPSVLGNAGSFFKNPVVTAARHAALKLTEQTLVSYPQPDGSYKLAAGWLIDQCGWKGRRVGAVGMHARQALVLVNYGGAHAHEVLALARAVRSSVQERFGVELEMEPVAPAA